MFFLKDLRDIASFVIIFVIIAIVWYVVDCGFSNNGDKKEDDE